MRVNVDSIMGHVVVSPPYHSDKGNFMTNRNEANRTILDFPGESMVRECSRETGDLLCVERFQEEWRPEFFKRAAVIARA